MPKHFFFLLLVFVASCNGGGHPTPTMAKGYHLRFNPPDSSRYLYHTTSITELDVSEGSKTYRIQRNSQFTANYMFNVDSDEFVFEMGFDSIDFHEHDPRTSHDDVATLEPVSDLLKQIRTATVFGRVRPSKQMVTLNWSHAAVSPVVNAIFAEADRDKATEFWGHWVEQALLWKNVDPFMWVKFDSAGHPGDHWADTTTNQEDINFRINKRLLFDRLDAAGATFRSQGRINTGPIAESVGGRPTMGSITGVEGGTCLVDVATGMPMALADTIVAEGNLQVDGRQSHVKIVELIKVTGKKVN